MFNQVGVALVSHPAQDGHDAYLDPTPTRLGFSFAIIIMMY